MGLTLHYELRLAAGTSPDEVTRALARLRQVAVQQPFAEVWDLVELSDATRDMDQSKAAVEFWAGLLAEPFAEDDPVLEVETARGFVVQPGEGCETATFGMMLSSLREWYWRCHCKTQYASLVSDEHFVAMHTALVRVLDAAIELGFQVDVTDEGGYWESRDVGALLRELHRMNAIVARVAGAISEAHDVKAPIFEHPRFERLEMGEES